MQQISAELNRSMVEFEDDEVEVYLPRLSTRSDFTLNSVLQDMGLLDIFDPNTSDLSKISKQSYLSRIIHKAQIEMNEEGTTASAATGNYYKDSLLCIKKQFIFFSL